MEQITTIALLPDAPDGEGFIRETEALNVRAVQPAPSSQPSASQPAQVQLLTTVADH